MTGSLTAPICFEVSSQVPLLCLWVVSRGLLLYNSCMCVCICLCEAIFEGLLFIVYIDIHIYLMHVYGAVHNIKIAAVFSVKAGRGIPKKGALHTVSWYCKHAHGDFRTLKNCWRHAWECACLLNSRWTAEAAGQKSLLENEMLLEGWVLFWRSSLTMFSPEQ